jgi:hypothetical protein
MTMTFQCPDCFQVHDEPLEAAFTLYVPCAGCATEAGLLAIIDARGRAPFPVAA